MGCLNEGLYGSTQKLPTMRFLRVTSLLALEELHLAFMFLCGFACIEGAKIFALPCSGILLFRVQAILARF